MAETNTTATINTLLIRAIRAKGSKNLFFTFVNDPVRLFHFDRATLWSLKRKTPKLIAVSGHDSFPKATLFSTQFTSLIKKIPNLKQIQKVQIDPQELDLKMAGSRPALFWLPFKNDAGDVHLGLLIEYWQSDKQLMPGEDLLKLANTTLFSSYANLFSKIEPTYSFLSRWGVEQKKLWGYLLLGTLILLIGIRVPLRIVAPCEVVPNEPLLVTAPLEGIIQHVLVKPGEMVQKGTLLFEYEREAPLKQLESARKEVAQNEAEVKRSLVQGLTDEKARDELAIYQLKLEKGKVALALAEYQASRLEAKAPEAGVVMLDAPDQWRGKPVKIGEKVLMLSDPNNTKLRMWLPEDDNILLDFNRPIKVFLNVAPTGSYLAKLIYIANESSVDAKQMASFIAEASWIEAHEGAKLGLKGSAILYGDNVSLIYYLFRRPIAKFRHLFGV